MTLARALVSGNDPDPRLAEDAVDEALAKSGLQHANGVLLFLTPEFAHNAQEILTAVARRTQCLQVAGGIASGVFTESGWALDRPAAAAMILGGRFSLGHPDHPEDPILSYAGSTIPALWANSGRRFGGAFGSTFAVRPTNANAVAWQHTRLAGEAGCSVQLHGADIAVAVSHGWKRLGKPQTVEESHGYDIHRLGGMPPLKNLLALLPTAFRNEPERHLHQIIALVSEENSQPDDTNDEACCPVALISANADQTLTLAERIAPGRHLTWAIRLPETAEADMRQSIDRLATRRQEAGRTPSAALVFSCIGRSPFFYGGEDRDLKAVTERFPGLPVIGVYGTAQIAPRSAHSDADNRQFQNTVVTALVSPQPETENV